MKLRIAKKVKKKEIQSKGKYKEQTLNAAWKRDSKTASYKQRWKEISDSVDKVFGSSNLKGDI